MPLFSFVRSFDRATEVSSPFSSSALENARDLVNISDG
jgi:hypothetical protein